MLSARGSFACAAVNGGIIVAGGGSRHAMFGAAGSRMSSVERYDVEKNEWVEMDGLLRRGRRLGNVVVLDGEDGEEPGIFMLDGADIFRSGGGIEWVRWHPRGYVVLAGSEDSIAWMWNGDKNVFLNMFSGHSSTVTCGDFTPDGKMVCTGSEDASLRIRNPENGECVHVVRDHPYHTEGLTC
ncbi:hypothetical protein IFM89_027857 [Coptis chinensis]|uniref:Uncharacterized protein n=1 Tax=Coptis chinensis TaxID=261450 RepID=A0A835HFI2_9MAGN|nr:hypothetical protein IFM89_027857 [Coptis chinensis]